jgi:hypothetical protein
MTDLATAPDPLQLFRTTHRLTASDRWIHFRARLGYKRGSHRFEPGLYALGSPTTDSPVFVTANYALSFDALRSSLAGISGYILVLDTQGINVWCAAGKGTFGTQELASRVQSTHLKEVVNHRRLILPQLGAPGVAAHQVKQLTGFSVEYGPVRAADLPAYLKTHKATPEMRRVQFTLPDRLVLVPVEVVHVILPTLIAAAILYFLGGWIPSLAVLAAVTAGIVLFPLLLPWLPTSNFSTKGLFLGGLAALPFAASVFLRHPDWAWWQQVGQAFQYLLAMPPVTAFIALNFTGSSTFTSRSGVRREIFTYIPIMAWMFGIGILLFIIFAFVR